MNNKIKSTELTNLKWTQPKNLPVTDYSIKSLSDRAKLQAFDILYQRGLLSLKLDINENQDNIDIIVSVMENV